MRSLVLLLVGLALGGFVFVFEECSFSTLLAFYHPVDLTRAAHSFLVGGLLIGLPLWLLGLVFDLRGRRRAVSSEEAGISGQSAQLEESTEHNRPRQTSWIPVIAGVFLIAAGLVATAWCCPASRITRMVRHAENATSAFTDAAGKLLLLSVRDSEQVAYDEEAVYAYRYIRSAAVVAAASDIGLDAERYRSPEMDSYDDDLCVAVRYYVKRTRISILDSVKRQLSDQSASALEGAFVSVNSRIPEPSGFLGELPWDARLVSVHPDHLKRRENDDPRELPWIAVRLAGGDASETDPKAGSRLVRASVLSRAKILETELELNWWSFSVHYEGEEQHGIGGLLERRRFGLTAKEWEVIQEILSSKLPKPVFDRLEAAQNAFSLRKHFIRESR
jgi:hypothetical protein